MLKTVFVSFVAALILAAGPSSLLAVSAPVGHVLLAVGSVERASGLEGARQRLGVGDPIYAGDSLKTGPQSYMHVRMVDQALVVLRPDTRLKVSVYQFDPKKPDASRIKLELVSGNSRTVSGKGGEAAKQGYRFNTPIAAVGLRGTDYTVVAGEEFSRVSVARGAVVVTPFGNGCTAVGFGPCNSATSQELSAEQRHAYLEVSAKNRIPSVVAPDQDPAGAANQNPNERPAEPNAKRPAPKSDAVASTSQRAAEKESVRPETVNAVVVGDALASAYRLHWGRWNPDAAAPTSTNVLSVLTTGREITVGNTEYGLVRSISELTLPTQGTFSFTLRGSDAVVRSAAGVESARVLGGLFSIDFFRRGFDTSLQVQHARGTESLFASGGVTYQGFLFSNPGVSNMSVNGAIASTGHEAAYLFEKSLLADRTLFGAARWIR